MYHPKLRVFLYISDAQILKLPRSNDFRFYVSIILIRHYIISLLDYSLIELLLT